MILHGMNIPAIDTRFTLNVTRIRFVRGSVRINGSFQQFLNISKGPIIQTRSHREAGFMC